MTVQRQLGAHKWVDGLDVRVRVGIHSGRPTLTDVGYIGLAVHATARVCWTAHGGQIVVSTATRTAIGTAAPSGIRFRSLWQHRLPGLTGSEMLFQIQGQGLRASFPALRTGRRSVARRLSADRRDQVTTLANSQLNAHDRLSGTYTPQGEAAADARAQAGP